MNKEQRIRYLYKKFLNNEITFYLFFMSLISSECNQTKEEIEENISLINDLLKVSDDFVDEENNEEYREQLIEGKNILEEDLKTRKINNDK